MCKEWYVDNQTGELVDWNTALENLIENYDYGDPTCGISFDEYYTYYGAYDLGF